jgi:hypothetical protein
MIVMCQYKSISRRSSIYTYVGIDFIVVIGTVKVLQFTETCTDRRTASTLQLENQKKWIKVLLSPKVSYFLEDLMKSDFSFM